MSERVSFVPGNGISLADPPRKDELSRHCLVRNCRYTLGHAEGRDSACSYCLEELEVTDPTVTHAGCQNSFHDHCFDEVLANNPNLLTPNPAPSKCPMCNELLYPWPALVGPLPPAEDAAREAARQAAAAEAERRRRAASTQARRAFAEAAARRGGAIAPNIQRDIVPNIRREFDLLDEIERIRQRTQARNFIAQEEAARQRNSALDRLLQLAQIGDDDVVRVIDVRLLAESAAIAVDLARMQRFADGLAGILAQVRPEVDSEDEEQVDD